MARMFPDRLPSDVKSDAEKKLYRAFQEQLSDRFTVFHSVKWLAPNLGNGTHDSEADFAIAHPELGILVLEVKGGLIHYNGREDRWYSNKYPVKDPFKQACANKYSLLNLLKAQPDWEKIWVPIGHAVAFPDCSICDRLPPHAPRPIILDSTQLHSLSNWIQSAMKLFVERRDTSFNARHIAKLEDFLNPSGEFCLGNQIEWTNENLIQLSERQLEILDYLEQHHRVAIRGCAGSGKTLLAIEKARRLNQQGYTVLLTCFNKALARFMREKLKSQKGIYVDNIHALCAKLAKQSGIDLSVYKNYDPNLLFDKIYPNLIADEIEAGRLTWRVDAAIVDEGQDLSEDFYLALQYLMKDGDRGIFYYFYDANQNIYNRHWKPPIEEVPFSLTKNWRNSKAIHSYILQFYNDREATVAVGTKGKPVETFLYTTQVQLKKILGRILHRLVIDEQVRPQDIMILTTRKMPSLENKFVGQFLITANPSPQSKQIECHTIHHFKGLESPIVILIETDLRQVGYLKNLLYVGASRARNHLIILRPDQPF